MHMAAVACVTRIAEAKGRRWHPRPAARETVRPEEFGRARGWDALALGMASETCKYCLGQGFLGKYGAKRVCHCVYRAAFRGVLNRWRFTEAYDGASFRVCEFRADLWLVSRRELVGKATVRWEQAKQAETKAAAEYWRCRSAAAGLVWQEAIRETRAAEEAKDEGGVEWWLFSNYHLGGMGSDRCARQLGLSRGNFFHLVYRVERELGKVFGELEPYALYPVYAYMESPNWPR